MSSDPVEVFRSHWKWDKGCGGAGLTASRSVELRTSPPEPSHGVTITKKSQNQPRVTPTTTRDRDLRSVDVKSLQRLLVTRAAGELSQINSIHLNKSWNHTASRVTRFNIKVTPTTNCVSNISSLLRSLFFHQKHISQLLGSYHKTLGPVSH